MRIPGDGGYSHLDGVGIWDTGDRYLEPDIEFAIGKQWKERYGLWLECHPTMQLEPIVFREPEMELAVRCLMEMGQVFVGVEAYMWRRMFRQALAGSEALKRHRETAPKITAKIFHVGEHSDMFRELYFSLVLPVAAALCAEEQDIAVELYLRRMGELEKRYLAEEQPVL